MKTIHLSIQRFGVQFQVAYEAEIELIPGGTEVKLEMLSLNQRSRLDNEGAEVEEAEEYLRCIREGMEEVLFPLGMGAYAIIYDLLVHYTAWPWLYRGKTEDYLREAMQAEEYQVFLPVAV